MIGRNLARLGVALVAVQMLCSRASAVDTMADWMGANNVTLNNNYTVISPTSAGGQFQGVIPVDPNVAATYYLGDQTLSQTLDFTTELHMTGTMTFSNPNGILPNLLFGWYSSLDTRHRIGLGFSNLTTLPGVPQADHLRVDLGYAATGGNRFPFVSADGTQTDSITNSILPNGTYPFTFDYVPAASGPGGMMSATVGDFFHTTQPLTTQPWDLDLFQLDSFGFQQRYRSSFPGHEGPYNLTISNVTYTGGTAAEVAIPGDFDSDDEVDGVDLGIWSGNYGTGTSVATGDADSDGDADGNDFLVWQQNLTGAPATVIPEPAALVLFSIGGLAALVRRRCIRT